MSLLSWNPAAGTGSGGGGTPQTLVLSNTTLSLVPNGGSVVLPTGTVSSIQSLNVSTLVVQEEIVMPSQIAPLIRLVSSGQIFAASVNAPLMTAFTGSFNTLGTTTANITNNATIGSAFIGTISTGSISTNQLEATDSYLSTVYADVIDVKNIQFATYTNKNLLYGTGLEANAGVYKASNTVMYGHNDNDFFNVQYELNADILQYPNSLAVFPNLSTTTLHVSSFIQMSNGSNIAVSGANLTYGGQLITTGNQGNVANWAQYPANAGYINFNNGSLNNINGISAESGDMNFLTFNQNSVRAFRIGRNNITLTGYQPTFYCGACNIHLQAGVGVGGGGGTGWYAEGKNILIESFAGTNLNPIPIPIFNCNTNINIIAHGGNDAYNPFYPAASLYGGAGIINLTAYNSYLAGLVPNPLNPGFIKLNAAVVSVGNNNTLPFGETARVDIEASIVDIIAGTLGLPNLFGLTGLTVRSRNGMTIRNLSPSSNYDSKLFVREIWGQSVLPVDGGIITDRNLFIQAQGNPGVSLSNVKTIYGQTQWGYNGVDIINLNSATGNYPNAITSNLSSLQGQINNLTISTTGGISSPALWYLFPALSTITLNEGLAFNNFASPGLAPVQSYNGVIFTDFSNQLNTLGLNSLALGLAGGNSLSTIISPLSQGGIGIYKLDDNTVLGDIAAQNVIFDNIYPLYVSTGQLYFNGSTLQTSNVSPTIIPSELTLSTLTVSTISGSPSLNIESYSTLAMSASNVLLYGNLVEMYASTLTASVDEFRAHTNGFESEFYLNTSEAYVGGPLIGINAISTLSMAAGTSQINVNPDNITIAAQKTLDFLTTSTINLTATQSIGGGASTILTYSTVGTYSWTAPAGVASIDITLSGAGGGGADTVPGANGGYVSGTLAVVPGVSYDLYVAGGGVGAGVGGPGGLGGFGGGGNGGNGILTSTYGAGGGGGSAIFNGATLLAAVGGGGGSSDQNASAAGEGGGQLGGDTANPGYGGTQSAGGLGFTAYLDGDGGYLTGGIANPDYNSGGGGGGYYGGGAGVGGGGGSDYVDLLTGTVVETTGGGGAGGAVNTTGANGAITISYVAGPSLTGTINIISPNINLTGDLVINGVPYAPPSSIYISTSYAVPADITVSSITMQGASASPEGAINFPKAVSGLASLQIRANATNNNGFVSILNENLDFDTLQASETVLFGSQDSAGSSGFASILGGNNYLKIRTIDGSGTATNLVEGANYQFALNSISSINGVKYLPYTGGGGGGGGGSGTNDFSTLIASDFFISTPGAQTMKMSAGLPPLGGAGLQPNTLTIANQTVAGTNTALAVGEIFITPYTNSPSLTNPLLIQHGSDGTTTMLSYNYNQTSLPGALYTNFNNIILNAGAQSLNASTINFSGANLNISSINGLAPGSGSGSVSNWAQYPVAPASQYINFGNQSVWLKGVGNAILTNTAGSSNIPITAKYFTAFDPGGNPGLGIFGLDGEGIPSILGGFSLPSQLHVSTLQVSGSNIISANPSTILVNGFDPVSNWYNYNSAYSTINIVQANDGVLAFSNGSVFPTVGIPITVDNNTANTFTQFNIQDTNGNIYPVPSPLPGPFGSYTFALSNAVPDQGVLNISAYMTNGGYNAWGILNNAGVCIVQQFGTLNQIICGGTQPATGTGLVVDMRETTNPTAISILNNTAASADLVVASNATKGLQTMRIWENAAGHLNITNGGQGISINSNTTLIPIVIASTVSATNMGASVMSNAFTITSNVIFSDGAGIANNNVLNGTTSGIFYKGVQLASASNVETWSLYNAISSVNLNNNRLVGTFSTVGAATSNYAIDLSNYVNYSTTTAGATTFGIRIGSSNLVASNHTAPQISLFTDLVNGGGGITSIDTTSGGAAPQPFTFNVNTLTLNASTFTASNVINANIAGSLFTPNNITPPVLNTALANVNTMYISSLNLANYTDPNSPTTITGSVNISPMVQSGISTLGVKAFGSPAFYVPLAIDKGYSVFGNGSYNYTGGPQIWYEPFPTASTTPQSRFGVLTGTWSYNGVIGGLTQYNDMQIGVGVVGDSTETNIFRQFWFGAISGINRSPYSISLVVDFSNILTNNITPKVKATANLNYTLTNITIRWLGPGSF